MPREQYCKAEIFGGEMFSVKVEKDASVVRNSV
jgi:hypothetical protein